MNSSPCERIQALLPLFAGADLEEPEAAVVRAHLIDCMACRGDASSFQRATVGLRQVMHERVPGVDEAMFASLQDSVLARVEAEHAEPASSLAQFQGSRRLGFAAASLALVGLGFWWGLAQTPASVWNRPPMVSPAGFEVPKAVPYSGPRATQLQLLGFPSDEAAEGNEAAGMRARKKLRSLVDEPMVLPRLRPH